AKFGGAGRPVAPVYAYRALNSSAVFPELGGAKLLDDGLRELIRDAVHGLFDKHDDGDNTRGDPEKLKVEVAAGDYKGGREEKEWKEKDMKGRGIDDRDDGRRNH
ncbi:unnamed protein product, partial [Prorocentrum cordatum]